MRCDDIITAVCDAYDVEPAMLYGEGRTRSVAAARHAAMWLIRRHMGWSLTHIGRHFRRDHTTVLAALNRVDCARARSEAMLIDELSRAIAKGDRLEIDADAEPLLAAEDALLRALGVVQAALGRKPAEMIRREDALRRAS